MSDGGCTNCGNKGGCDHRKGEMFAAIDAALARLYPTRCFDERREDFTPETLEQLDIAGGVAGDAPSLAGALASRLKTLVVELPPTVEEYCRHVYVLCFGRQPCLVEALQGLAAPAREDLQNGPIEELYLRVSLSDIAPFAAVQQVAMRGELTSDDSGNEMLLIEETPRTGVFDPVLLPRMQRLVAVLSEQGWRNLDFGDISAPPPGFDPGHYAERFGGAPVVANYFFYPQPCSSITTTIVAFPPDAAGVEPRGGRAMPVAIGKPAVVI